jgi:hypothetical protein
LNCALVGAGARRDYGVHLLANILQREIYILHVSEFSACIGAAKLDFLAYGRGCDLLQAGMQTKCGTFLQSNNNPCYTPVIRNSAVCCQQRKRCTVGFFYSFQWVSAAKLHDAPRPTP